MLLAKDTEFNLPKIILLDANPYMTEAWARYFKETPVEVVRTNLKDLMRVKRNVMEVIAVSVNSLGLIDGRTARLMR